MKEPISPVAMSPISFSLLIERSEFDKKIRLCGIFVRIEVVSIRVSKLIQYQKQPIPSICLSLKQIFVLAVRMIINDLKTRLISRDLKHVDLVLTSLCG